MSHSANAEPEKRQCRRESKWLQILWLILSVERSPDPLWLTLRAKQLIAWWIICVKPAAAANQVYWFCQPQNMDTAAGCLSENLFYIECLLRCKHVIDAASQFTGQSLGCHSSVFPGFLPVIE